VRKAKNEEEEKREEETQTRRSVLIYLLETKGNVNVCWQTWRRVSLAGKQLAFTHFHLNLQIQSWKLLVLCFELIYADNITHTNQCLCDGRAASLAFGEKRERREREEWSHIRNAALDGAPLRRRVLRHDVIVTSC